MAWPAAGGRLRPALPWLLPAAVIVATCGWLGLIEPTETRYAEIAREMLASGNWLTPHLNGIPHFHKPPIAYWAAAAGMAALGVNEWGARVGAALAAAFVLWCTARIGRGATLAPILLASTGLFFALSRQLASDIFLAAAVAGFYAAYFDARCRRGLWPFVALGLGFMAKGPIVLVLTAAPVLFAALWSRDGAAARPLARWRGWLLFAAIALPWYLAVVVKTPGLFSYLLERQIWERYTTTVHQRGGPLYYFLGVILVGALPWTWAALREGWRAVRGEAAGAGRPAAPRFENALLITWIAVPTVFLSFSGSKLPAYVLPVFPALAVLAGRAFGSPAWGTRAHIPGGAAVASAIALLALAGGALVIALLLARHSTLPAAIWVATLLAAAALAAGGISSLRGRTLAAGTLALLGLLAALWGARPFDSQLGSPNALARTLRESRRPGEPVVEFETFNAGIPYYLGEEVPMLEVPRDLGFEDPATRAHMLIQRADLVHMVAEHDRAWLVGNGGAIERLANSLGLHATNVAGSGNQTLVVIQRGG